MDSSGDCHGTSKGDPKRTGNDVTTTKTAPLKPFWTQSTIHDM